MGFVAELAEVRERLTVLGQRFDPALTSAADAEKVLGRREGSRTARMR